MADQTPHQKETAEQQDEILQMFEDNQIAMNGVSAQAFFYLLLGATLEGAYADPVYGGNKDMLGWKMNFVIQTALK